MVSPESRNEDDKLAEEAFGQAVEAGQRAFALDPERSMETRRNLDKLTAELARIKVDRKVAGSTR